MLDEARGCSHPSCTPVAEALRRGVLMYSTRTARERSADRLRRSLQSFIDAHPRSSAFVLDAGDGYEAFWQRSFRPMPSRRALVRFDAAATLEGSVLLHLTDDVDAFGTVLGVCFVTGDMRMARRVLQDAIERHSPDDYGAQVFLWAALYEQWQGAGASAHDTYRTTVRSRAAPVRRSALAAGALHAGANGRRTDAEWFLERMLDEEPEHQSKLVARSLRLRTNRLGARDADRAMSFLCTVATTGYTRARWHDAYSWQ